MFYKTYGLKINPETKKFDSLIYKVVNFEKKCSIFYIGYIEIPRESGDQVYCIEYNNKAYLFNCRFGNAQDIGTNPFQLGIVTAKIYCQDIRIHDNAKLKFNCLKPDTEFCFKFNSVEEYYEIIDLIKEGLVKFKFDITFSPLIKVLGAPVYLSFSAANLPEHMQPDLTSKVIKLKDLSKEMYGNPENITFGNLINLKTIYDVKNRSHLTPTRSDETFSGFISEKLTLTLIEEKTKVYKAKLVEWVKINNVSKSTDEVINTITTRTGHADIEWIIAQLILLEKEFTEVEFERGFDLDIATKKLKKILCDSGTIKLLRECFKTNLENQFTSYEEFIINLAQILQKRYSERICALTNNITRNLKKP